MTSVCYRRQLWCQSLWLFLNVRLTFFKTLHNFAEWGTDSPKHVRKCYCLLLPTVIQFCNHNIIILLMLISVIMTFLHTTTICVYLHFIYCFVSFQYLLIVLYHYHPILAIIFYILVILDQIFWNERLMLRKIN